MQYQIKQALTGYRVHYRCQHCNAQLNSPLNEAGMQDVCPDCARRYVVPGERERQAKEKEAAHQRVLRERQRQEAKREREQRKQERLAEQAQVQERLRQEQAQVQERLRQEQAEQAKAAKATWEVKRGLGGIGFIPFTMVTPFTDVYYSKNNREAEVVAKRLRLVASSVVNAGWLLFFLDLAWVFVGVAQVITLPFGNANGIFQQMYIRNAWITVAVFAGAWIIAWGARVITAAILYGVFSLVVAAHDLKYTK